MAKTPAQTPRLHYIPEWADKRDLRQTDIVAALQEAGWRVDKSTVSRWFKGSLPEEKHILALAGLFGFEDEPAALFRHPEDDWLSRLLRARSEEERFRIRQMVEAALALSKAS